VLVAQGSNLCSEAFRVNILLLWKATRAVVCTFQYRKIIVRNYYIFEWNSEYTNILLELFAAYVLFG